MLLGLVRLRVRPTGRRAITMDTPPAGSHRQAAAITAGRGSSPLSADLTGGGEVISERLFELEKADRVMVRVDEPGREREPDVGDAFNRIQLWEILDLDAARPESG